VGHKRQPWGKHIVNNNTEGNLYPSGPIVRRFRTRQAHLKYNYLKKRVYSETMFSDKKSVHGMTCAQVFVTTEGFVKVYAMKNKGEAYNALNNFCVTVRLPLTIMTDKSKEEYGGNWDMVRKNIYYSRIRQSSKSGN